MSNSSDPTKTGVLEGESKRKRWNLNCYDFNENVYASFIQNTDIQPQFSLNMLVKQRPKVFSLEKQSYREDESFIQVIKIWCGICDKKNIQSTERQLKKTDCLVFEFNSFECLKEVWCDS